MKKIIKLLPLFGVAGVVFYFLHVFFGTLFYTGYNPMAQAVSDLTASNSPSKDIAMPFMAGRKDGEALAQLALSA